MIGLTKNLGAAVGAALIGFHSSPGRTVEQQLDMLYLGIANIIDPKFAGGAVGDGDAGSRVRNTAAIQAALDSLQPGQTLRIPAGNYITDPLSCATNGIRIEGDADNAAYQTCLIAMGNNQTILTLSGSEVSVCGVGFLGAPSLKVAGAGASCDGVRLTGDGSDNIDSTIRNCAFLCCRAGLTTEGRNVNVYDNIFANSKIGIEVNPSATGQCRDFIVSRNRFHHMGDVAGSTWCISLTPGSMPSEVQIMDNFYDGQGFAMFIYGHADQLMVSDNRISTPKYRWIDVSGNIVRIEGNSFEGNTAADATGFGIAATGNDVTIEDNTIINAPFEAIVLGPCDRFKVSENHITDASTMKPGQCDAISLTASCTNGVINDNRIINTTTAKARYGIAGEAPSTTAHGNTFLNCALGNVNSTTFYNTTATPFGCTVEGASGVLRASGTRYKEIANGVTVDVAYIDFDSDYGACLFELKASMFGQSAALVYAKVGRYIINPNGVPDVSTVIGVDAALNCTVGFSAVAGSPKRVKVTFKNNLAQNIRGGICIDLCGGGSNTQGRAGATLTML